MAGIGFALNNLVNKKDFMKKVSGYFYTASSCLGSMILGFTLLFVIQYLAKSIGQDISITERFTTYVTNIVFLSMIIFSPISLVLSRYLSDMIYEKKESHIKASFWGVVSIIVPISFICIIPILIISKIEMSESILLWILLAELVVTWVVTLYITILKEYKKITLTFGLAIILAVTISIILYKMNLLSIETMLLTVIVSYGIVLILLTRMLQKQFSDDNFNNTYEFVKWFSKYPSLAFAGLFSTLGTLAHFYIMWFSPNGKEVKGLMHSAASYDLPAIVAYFSTIITSINFIAVLEPNFYKKYSVYFKLLNESGTYKQLQVAKKEMQDSLKIELRNLILKQIVCTLFFVIVISKLLSNLNSGMTQSMIECFKVLSIGYSLYAIGNVIMQMELYFADNKGAFRTAIIFFIITTISTIMTIFLGETFWGLGLTLGSACMAIYGSKRLEKYINNLEYYVLNTKNEKKHSWIYIIIKKINIKIKQMGKNKKVKAVMNIGVISMLVAVLSVSLYKGGRITEKTIRIEDNGAILNNAGVGLAPWAKNEETLNMNTKLVYIDLSWKEWEPSEGKFNIEEFENKNHIEEYKKQGKQAVFRFYMDYPSSEEHKDIPQWLYNKINGDGTWYNTSYGKGFSPNYANPTLIKYHEKAIKALAERYANDDFFIYIELGSIGHWGEWHVNHNEGVKRLPEYDIRKQYIEPYKDNFKTSKLLMRYSVQDSKEYNCGLYNDATGDIDETEYWLEGMEGKEVWEQTGKNELANNLDTWKHLPIGGEFASSFDNAYFLKEHLDMTMLLIKQSHQSFLGPKIIIDEANSSELSKQMDEILKILGHRIYAKKVIIKQGKQEELNVSINLTNSGIAPIYEETKLVLYVYDTSGNLITTSEVADFDARTILPQEEKNVEMNIDTSSFEKKDYYLCMSLNNINLDKPSVELPMKQYKDKIYEIGKFSW